MSDINIQLYRPHSQQKLLHSACNDFTKATKDKNGKILKEAAPFFVLVSAGRRSGKTKAGMNQLAYWACKEKTQSCWFSPRESQAQKIFKQMALDFAKAGVLKKRNASASAMELVLTNGSTIQFRSAEADIATRGNEYHYIIVDECAYVKEKTFTEAILPTTFTLGRKILMISTPRGRTNWFCKFYENPDKLTDRVCFNFSSLDNPYNDKANIAMALKVMTASQYAQEVEGRFVEGSNPFEGADACFGKVQKDFTGVGKVLFAGVDIGFKNDFTVVTVIDSDGNVVFIDRFNNMPAPAIRERIVKTLREYKVRKCMIETNNQGLGIIDEIKASEPVIKYKIVDFTTTHKSKIEIIEELISAFANKRILLKSPNEDKNVSILREEIDGFGCEYENGKVFYQAEQGFDDCVMSLAIALRCVKTFKYMLNTTKFIIG